MGTLLEFKANVVDGVHNELTKKLKPIMLRRRKNEVATDLPPRTEEIVKIPFTAEQSTIYDAQLNAARSKCNGTMQLLTALTRLRQICCHPKLVEDNYPHTAAKLELLTEMVTELLAEEHNVLIFSQFTSMLDIIKAEFDTHAIPHLKLTGSTPNKERAQLVNTFNDSDEPQAFLLSLKAAGTGLTLTKADYVIIFDPWWNPAVENQAIDRTHRIGQKRPVIAYRFIMADSIEEKVLDLQDEKRAIFQAAVDGVEMADVSLTADDLARLLE